MTTPRYPTLAVLLALLCAPTAAHHNMNANFDFNQRVTQTGVLKELDWRNPHIYLFVDVVNDAGATETWSFEGPPTEFFRRRSFSRSAVEESIGQNVTIEASRARDGSTSGLIREVSLPNGLVVSACPQNC
jgi:hypothetical protein